MHRQAVGLSETVLGEEHPDTLGILNNLALVALFEGTYLYGCYAGYFVSDDRAKECKERLEEGDELSPSKD